jgi:magnesium transporter
MPHTNRVHKTGLPPGSLLYTGVNANHKVVVRQYSYNSEQVICNEPEPGSLTCAAAERKCWTEIRGLHNLEVVRKIGDELGLNSLMLEDMVNVRHAPALSTGKGVLMLSIKHINWESPIQAPVHVNLLLSGDRVISLSDSVEALFEPVARRLEDEGNLLRSFGADHLFLRLVDMVTDHYLPALQTLRDDFDRLLEGMMREDQNQPLPDIIALHRRISSFRPVILPLYTSLSDLQSELQERLSPGTDPYLRDILDHLRQAVDEHRALSDAIPILLELHHTNVSNRMNAVMKTLTVVASIFIPLTFLVGVYGMNFSYMPELSLHWAYPALWGLMLAIVLGMLWYMHRRNWL